MWRTDLEVWAQPVRIDQVCDEWLRVLHSTEPVRRADTEAAFRRLHARVGLPSPAPIVWVDSPLEGCLAAFLMTQRLRQARGETAVTIQALVQEEGWSRPGLAGLWRAWHRLTSCPEFHDDVLWEDTATKRLNPRVERALEWTVEAARMQIDQTVLEQTHRHIERHLLNTHRSADIEVIVTDQIDLEVSPTAEAWMYYAWLLGGHEPSTLAAWELGAHMGLEVGALQEIVNLARLCGGWWTVGRGVVLAERPCRLHVDQAGRPHSQKDRAIAYRDGWGVYAWHGVRVPESVILRPETVSPRQILEEKNLEVRRVMIERVGLERFLVGAGARLVNCDQGGKRQLYRLNLPNDEPIVAVRVQCPSTGQWYVLRVPPQMRTCREAVAWTFGFEEDDDAYQPVIET